MTGFLLGCDFWDSRSGTDMWLHFDAESLRQDLRSLAETGVRAIRCFPNWRDFQPVIALRKWRGNFGEYRLTGDRLPENEYYIDTVMIERFRLFAAMAEEVGIQLVVSIVTGWMSGQLFCPPALDGKNLITDHEALMLEEKFVRGFVRYARDIPNIVMWDLGNECNCLGHTGSRTDAYLWTVTIRNAILASDSTRPISSGMHGLEFDPYATWSIETQGELCDILTPHPYPSPTIGGDVDPANTLRTTMLPLAQCEYYGGLSGKPTMIQEQGTLNDMLISRTGAAEFLRVNICSSLANGQLGYFWWCSHEHLHLTKPPYTWSMIERELGLVDANRVPKPVGDEMKRLGNIIDALPAIPEKETDAVIVLSREQRQWEVGATAFILAKRAGLTPVLRSCSQALPPSQLYILPSITGWASLYKETYDALLTQVYENGAVLLITVASGFMCEFERVTGLRSNGMQNAGRDTMDFAGTSYPMEYTKKFFLESLGAEILAKDSTGNPVFTKNRFGKGTVYMLMFPLENMLWNRPGAYGPGTVEYSNLYAHVAGPILDTKPMRSGEPDVSITIHPEAEGAIVIAVNYTNTIKDSRYTLADGYRLEPIFGDFHAVEGCGMAVGRIVKM